MMEFPRFRTAFAMAVLASSFASAQDLSHRKASLQVVVNDLAAQPLAGATVKVEMLNPAFRFGTALTTNELTPGANGYSARGLQEIQASFNSVTYGNAMKWSYVTGRSLADNLALVAQAQALRPFDSDFVMGLRGHTTIWGAEYQLPASFRALTSAEDVKAAVRQHAADYHAIFKDTTVTNFDLYNENFGGDEVRRSLMAKAVPGSTATTMIAEQAAEAAEWFKAAQAADPKAKLFVNEFNMLNFWQEDDARIVTYKAFVDAIRDAGGPVGGIGLQAHMDRFITKAQIKRRLDLLAAPMAPTTSNPAGLPGLPIEVTELDINTQWWTTATPQQQAEVTANVLEAAFEHPAVEGVTIWGIRDSQHWRDNAIMFDDSDPNNWVLKPSGQAWVDRVKGTWWTNLTGLSDSAGRYTGSVFKGQHRITVTYNGQTQTFVRDLSVDSSLAVAFDTTPPDTSNSYLTNLSVRAPLATGQTLSLGFVVDGGSKNLLVRAGGPMLSEFLTGTMSDPEFFVQWAGTEKGGNDDWNATAIQPTANALGAFPFQSGSLDAAAIVNVAGPNTVEITGPTGGIVLGEVYDTAAAVTGPRLSNVSARSTTGSGANVLTAGFYVGGTGQARLLVRGVGPTLAGLGVLGTIPNPRVTIFDSGGNAIATNDDWDAGLQGLMDTLGAYPLDAGSKDAAMVVVVNAGALYSVQVTDVAGGNGVALIEVYEVR